MRRLPILALILVLGSGLAQGYYHFLRYVGREGRLVPLAQKFDLNALTNKTVPYFLTERQPTTLATGDSMTSLVSQIRLAARQWNDVETSELRLQFGGVSNAAPAQTAPGIDILFDDIPPGLIAYGGPTVTVDPPAGARFVSIQRSQIVLPRDMSKQPSWSEATFATIVHEFGHAVGLQHTLTSSVMSTQLTRAVTKGRVLAADDIAGISQLYPTRAFQSALGSIAGRVTSAGEGVALASVVAISPVGPAISVLTNPDGTYQIDGIPPGPYNVYVHPLPPAQTGEATPANIVLPVDQDRRAFQPSPAFEWQFYPGVREASQAGTLPVTAATVLDGVNFSVAARRTPQSLYNVLTYGFPGQVAVRPAHVNKAGSRNFFVATGTGLTVANTQPVPGLQTAVLGGATTVSGTRPYSAGYLQFDLAFSSQSGEGARHLVFSTPNDVYIQPSSLILTSRQPPQISSVQIEGRTMTIQGANLGADTGILIDGSPVVVQSVDEVAGRMTVALPPASSGHLSAIVAANADGQSSLFLQGDTPAMQALEGSDPGGMTINPSQLAAGTETVIEVNAPGAAFADGQVTVGFGVSDIAIKRLWVMSPTRLLAQVVVGASAVPTAYTMTVANGLQTASVPQAMTVLPAPARQLQVIPTVVNPLSGIGSASVGGALLVQVAGTSSLAFTATIGDRPASLTALGPGVAFVQVPAGIAPGPAILKLQSGSDAALPIVIEIEPPATASVKEATTVRAGETVTLTIPGLRDLSTPFSKLRVGVNVGGIEHLAQISPVNNTVSFTLLPSVASGSTNVSIVIDGRILPSVQLTVAR